ncbi:ABC transporter permease [Pseudobutyrivibrio sp.]
MLEGRLGSIKQYLFVINQISYKEHKKKTDETNLGVLWNILNPFLYMVILSTYYQNVIIHKIENFPLFVFTGITIYNFYNNGTKGAMHSLVGNKSFLIKARIPSEIYLLQKVFSAFKEMMFSAVALIPIMLFFHIRISWRMVQLIPILLLTIATIIGIGEILAITYVYFADIDYLYSVFMTMMVFTSGVFIPIDHLPESLQVILTYNPIFLSIYLVRNALFYNLPSHWTAWIKLIIWTVSLVVLGHIFFVKNKNKLVGKL